MSLYKTFFGYVVSINSSGNILSWNIEGRITDHRHNRVQSSWVRVDNEGYFFVPLCVLKLGILSVEIIADHNLKHVDLSFFLIPM